MVAVISASLVLMSIYLKRAYSGRVKTQSDSLGMLYDTEGINSISTYSVTSYSTTNSYIDNVTINGENYLGLVTVENIEEDVTQIRDQTITK